MTGPASPQRLKALLNKLQILNPSRGRFNNSMHTCAGAVARIRNALATATHAFFQQEGFLYVHTPIITCSDCEGAGEMFQVRRSTMRQRPRAPFLPDSVGTPYERPSPKLASPNQHAQPPYQGPAGPIAVFDLRLSGQPGDPRHTCSEEGAVLYLPEHRGLNKWRHSCELEPCSCA